MSGRDIGEARVRVDAVAMALQLLHADHLGRAHVARVDDRQLAGVPVAGVEHAVAVDDGLRLARLQHPDVRGTGRIAHVDALDAEIALSAEEDGMTDVDAGRQFDRVDTRDHPAEFAVGDREVLALERADAVPA